VGGGQAVLCFVQKQLILTTSAETATIFQATNRQKIYGHFQQDSATAHVTERSMQTSKCLVKRLQATVYSHIILPTLLCATFSVDI
jgi:hypothetical protein